MVPITDMGARKITDRPAQSLSPQRHRATETKVGCHVFSPAILLLGPNDLRIGSVRYIGNSEGYLLAPIVITITNSGDGYHCLLLGIVF